MTTKAYIMHELEGRGYSRYEQVPEEMLDYLPENMDNDDEEESFIVDDGRNSSWFVHVI